MVRFHSLALAALISSASLLQAQTGPSGNSVPLPGPGPGNVQPYGAFTPDRLSSYLRNQGHTVEVKRHPNGAVTVVAQIQKDSWRYVLEVEYTIDQKTINFVCPLGNSNAQYSSAQLLALLKTSYGLNPVHFSYREADHRLCLEDPIYNAVTMNETQFQNIADRLFKIVRDTHPQWDPSRWPTNGQPAAASGNPALPSGPVAPKTPASVASQQPTAPSAPQAPGVPAMQSSLANSTWVGSEQLGSYGRLEFRFGPNGQVTMIDKDGNHPGTYTVQNNTMTLTFYNGTVSYTGTVNGQTFSGNASNGQNTWAFTVSR